MERVTFNSLKLSIYLCMVASYKKAWYKGRLQEIHYIERHLCKTFSLRLICRACNNIFSLRYWNYLELSLMAATIECVILSEATECKLRIVTMYIPNAYEWPRSLPKSSIMVVENFGQRNVYLFFNFKSISTKNWPDPAWTDGNASVITIIPR